MTLYIAIQGVGGGCVQTLTSIIISDLVPLRERGLFQGITGLYAYLFIYYCLTLSQSPQNLDSRIRDWSLHSWKLSRKGIMALAILYALALS